MDPTIEIKYVTAYKHLFSKRNLAKTLMHFRSISFFGVLFIVLAFMGVQRNFKRQILVGYTYSQSWRQVLLHFETIPGRVGWGVEGKHLVILLSQFN